MSSCLRDMSKQLKISSIQVTSSNVAEEELEISGGRVSFTKRFLKASKRTRRAFPEPQPFTAPNFPPNVNPQYKPTPHTRPCSRKSPSFRGQSLQAEGQAETPLLLSARLLLGTLLVNHKAARNRTLQKKKKKKKKESFSFNPPKGNPKQEQHHSTIHSTDIYHCLCTDSFPDTRRSH
ncbi:uncharacterized protein WM294_004180 [Sarcoramphus papa]